jgi:hypothetical protein
VSGQLDLSSPHCPQKVCCVGKEPDALINFLVPRHGFFDNFGVLCKIFLDVRYRKGKTCVIGLMGAPIFSHHLSYASHGNYGTLSNSKSVKLGGVKLRRDKAVFRNSQLHHRIKPKL